ncbi:MAG TPA: BamA/TamA family outer membrane protein [Gemmatimonadaceae bacterium]|nr:BamA/TamA family outer membrane protein [Gemmatimonadaceae bacterium]
MSARPLGFGLLLALVLVGSSTRAAAQDLICDPGDREVRRVEFEGNTAFSDERLASAIATTASSWWSRVGLSFLGARRCLDPLELQRDVLRLRYFYRQRGYYQTQVDTAVVPLGDDIVAVHMSIAEGPPVVITSLSVSGLDSMPGGEQLAQLLRRMEGRVYDRVQLQSIVDTIVERLHDRGYANAQHLLRQDSVDYSRNVALVDREFLPGRVHRIASIDLEILPVRPAEAPSIHAGAVRSLLSFEVGDIYRERDLFRSQRDLYLLDAYRHVEIRLRTDSLQPPGDSLLAVVVRLSEREMTSVRAGVGWATLDCFRTQARLINRDFLGGARRIELDARLTKIARGEPLDFAQALCTGQSKDDQFSDTLNYYGGVTLRQPTLLGTRNVPSLTLYSERRSEFQAYERTTPIGSVLSLTREQRPRLPLTLAYQFEFGRTRAEQAVFCSVFNVCDLGDIARLTRRTRLAVLSATASRDRTDSPLEPTRGDQVRLELRHASAAIGSDPLLEFNRAAGSASFYLPFIRGTVLALRTQGAVVFSVSSLRGAEEFVPPQERLYAGGPTSVRGYNQNELGPVVYLVTGADTVLTAGGDTLFHAGPTAGIERASPTGGNALLVGNAELRVRSPFLPQLLDWVGFLDAGSVYNRGSERFSLDDLKWTPGVGLRVSSPVGPLRMDVAYNGYPRRAGAAYLIDPIDIGDGEGSESDRAPRLLRCASPGNTLPSGVGGACPSTFAPPSNKTFFSRLVFHFSVGQAF